MEKTDRIYIANHEKMPGKAFVRVLRERGFGNLLLRKHSELDLLDQHAVLRFFQKEKPDYVFLASLKSGGIQANIEYPAEFLYENLEAQNNVINSAKEAKVKKLLFVAASCVYPKNSPQPMKEEYLLTGELEKTSEPYSIAKIAGIKLCEYYNRHFGDRFISIIPATVYGPDDNFDIPTAHVIPALIRRFHEAKLEGKTSVSVWGSGKARREFIYEDDLVDACIFLMENFNTPGVINVGTGKDFSIIELAELIKNIVGFKGILEFDTSKPEGVAHKLLDVTRLNSLSWKEKMDITTGMRNTYEAYINTNRTSR